MATELQQGNREDPNIELSRPSIKTLSSNAIHSLSHTVSIYRYRYCKNPAMITSEPGVIPLYLEAGHAQTTPCVGQNTSASSDTDKKKWINHCNYSCQGLTVIDM